jgi:hypothetical protein
MKGRLMVVIALAAALAGGGWRAYMATPSPAPAVSDPPAEGTASSLPQEPKTATQTGEPSPLPVAEPAGIDTIDNGYDRLLAEEPSELWGRWRDLLAHQEWSQLPAVGSALAQRLREPGNEAIYQAITGLLQQPRLPLERKAALLDLLRETATPESLGLMLETALAASDPALRKAASNGIARIGDNRWDGRFHEELSPLLESAWSHGEIKDRALRSAIALAIAKIGAPSGVDVLLGTVAGKASAEDEAGQAAALSMGKIHNPHAVPVLAQWFQRYPMGKAMFEIIGGTLANLGSPDATQVLLNWARQAPAEAAPLLGPWFKGLHDTTSIQLVREALSEGDAFQSPRVRQAITSVLERN